MLEDASTVLTVIMNMEEQAGVDASILEASSGNESGREPSGSFVSPCHVTMHREVVVATKKC